MDKKIPLSTLIEIGCRKTRPVTHCFIERRGEEVFACALGAAAVALEGSTKTVQNHLHRGLEWVVKQSAVHPVTGIEYDLYTTITDLNDHHHWPREHVAYWLKLKGL